MLYRINNLKLNGIWGIRFNTFKNTYFESLNKTDLYHFFLTLNIKLKLKNIVRVKKSCINKKDNIIFSKNDIYNYWENSNLFTNKIMFTFDNSQLLVVSTEYIHNISLFPSDIIKNSTLVIDNDSINSLKYPIYILNKDILQHQVEDMGLENIVNFIIDNEKQ